MAARGNPRILRDIAHRIVTHRRAVLFVAAVLAIVAGWGMANNKINYDILSYLPQDLQSVRGFDILQSQFSRGNSAQILLERTPDIETAQIVARLEELPGVKSVSWVTELAELEVPKEFWHQAVMENFYGGDATIITATFTFPPNDPRTRAAYNGMKRILRGKKAHIAGTQQLDIEDVIAKDRTRFSFAAMGFVGLVLVLTIPSIIIPGLFVVAIALSAVYSLGLSYYLGQEMSYLTGVIVFALQFAVTMDYALFLYHRYEEAKVDHPKEEAMELAMVATFKAVVAACLTTVAGFLALTAMKLGFGVDMGLTLARGVVITLIVVLTVLPAMLLELDALIARFRHPVKTLDFSKIGEVAAEYLWALSVLAIALFAPALWGNSKVMLNYNLSAGMPEKMPSVVAQDRIGEKFGRLDSLYVIVEKTPTNVELQSLSARLERVPGVTRVFSYTKLVDPRIPDEFVPAQSREAFFKGGRSFMVLDIAYKTGDRRLTPLLAAARRAIAEEGASAYLTGGPALMQDMEKISEADVSRVNLISVVAIFIIVAIAFRSLSVPVVLVGLIQLAILFNQAVSGFRGSEIMFIASLAIGAIQLGATVDYAILLTSRYEQELERLGDKKEAIKIAVGASAQSILVSAGTMFAATIGMVMLSNVRTISDLAGLISRGALISFLCVLLLLPALLVAAQSIFERTSIGWPRVAKRET